MTNKNNKKGFTIIEVVLVLAIAGLIFLMVFIALPALQRSQRNTRRRQDMARILSAFNDYQANNNGQFPKDAAALNPLANNYIKTGSDDTFKDPDGSDYGWVGPNTFGETTSGSSSSMPTPGEGDLKEGEHKIGVFYKAKCNGESVKEDDKGGARSLAITYTLEGGAVYCGDNQ